jgi:PAS domain S-box-containing protein
MKNVLINPVQGKADPELTLEEALVASEIRYRRLFESAKDGILILNAKSGKIVDVNPFLINLLGYSREDFIEKAIWEIGFFKDILANKDKFLELQQEEYVRYNDLPLETADGRKINVEFVSNVYREGNYKVIQCNIRDTTERKLAESEFRFHSEVLQNLSEGVNMVRPSDGMIIYANTMFNQMFGYNTGELIGKHISIINAPDDKSPCLKADEIMSQLSRTGFWKGQVHNIRKDGSTFWCRANVTPFQHSQYGEVWLSIQEDITIYKNTEDALRESEQKFRTIFENVQDVFYEVSLDGTILEVSPSIGIQSKGRYFRENLIGKSMYDFYSIPGGRQALLTSLKERGSVTDYEVILKNLDGSNVPCSISAKIQFDANHTPLKIIGSIRDITERKRAEEVIRQKTALLEAQLNSSIDGILIVDNLGKKILQNQRTIDIWKIPQHIADNEDDHLQVQYVMHMTKNPEMFVKKITDLYEHPDINSFDDVELVDGTVLERYSAPVLDKYGQNYGRIWTFHDITERKRAVETLIENEAKYRTLVTQSPDGIFIVDLSGTFLSVNKTMCDNLKYSEEEFFSMKLWNIIPQKYISLHKSRLADILKGERKNEAVEYEVKGKDGIVHYIEVMSAPYYKDKVIIGFQGIARDITEKKRVEEELQAKEKKFKELFDNAPIGYHELDSEGRIAWINRTELDMLGYTEEEMIGQFVWKFLGDEEISKQRVSEKLNGIRPPSKSEERVYRRKDQTTFPILVEDKILRDAANRIIGIRTTIQDITRRKLAEETLHESEAKLDEAMKIAKLGTWVYDVASDQFKFNDQFYTLLHTTAEQEGSYIMSPLHYAQKFLHPDDMAMVGMETQKALETTDPNYFSQLDHRIIYANGEIGYLSVNIRIEKDSCGHTVKTYGVNQDITERKLAEKEILILAHSLSSINECVSITDLEDKIIFVNDSFLKTYGYNKNDLIGKHISLVRSLKNSPELVKKIFSATTQGGWQGELLNRRKDGSEFLIYLSTTMIKDKESKPLGLIGVATDITERKRFEKELIKAKNKAEESDRLKSAFLANMSHEIRTPMNGILGFTDLLKETKLTGDQQLEYINIIQKSGSRMLNIINDIISISKVESGQIEVSVSDTNINEQVEYIYTFFKPEAEQKNLHFSFKNSLPINEAIIKTDREKVYAILTNLVKNALKFTKTGSIKFGYEVKGEILEFFIKDTGIGIAKAQKELIFERFRQGNESSIRNYEGAGLGLSISKAYVEMLGGKIWLKSEEGKGSTFYFTLPFNAPEGISRPIIKETLMKNNLEGENYPGY